MHVSRIVFIPTSKSNVWRHHCPPIVYKYASHFNLQLRYVFRVGPPQIWRQVLEGADARIPDIYLDRLQCRGTRGPLTLCLVQSVHRLRVKRLPSGVIWNFGCIQWSHSASPWNYKLTWCSPEWSSDLVIKLKCGSHALSAISSCQFYTALVVSKDIWPNN